MLWPANIRGSSRRTVALVGFFVFSAYWVLARKFRRLSEDAVVVNADCHVIRRQGHEFWPIQTMNFSLGTPPRSFNATLSITSTEVFVPSGSFPWLVGKFSDACSGCTRYKSSASRTYRKEGTRRTHGSVAAVPHLSESRESINTLTVAGGIKVPNQHFQEDIGYLEDELGTRNPDYTLSGFGLAPPQFPSWDLEDNDDKNHNIPGPLQTMIERKVLQRNMFALKLARNATHEGHIMFGGYDNTLFEGDLVKHPWFLPETNLWGVEASSLSLTTTDDSGRQDFLLNESLTGVQAILSTQPIFAFSKSILDKILASLNATNPKLSDHGKVDCELDLDKLPVMTIEIGDQKFEFTANDYVEKRQSLFSPGNVECTVVFGKFYDGDAGPNDNYGKHIWLGSYFLQKLYTVFDWDEKTISCKLALIINLMKRARKLTQSILVAKLKQ
jgi:hypothetical protein